MSFSFKNFIPWFFVFFYRLQSGATLQTAPPRNDLDPLHISCTGDGGRSRLQHRKAFPGKNIVFENGTLVTVHAFAVDFNVLVHTGKAPGACALTLRLNHEPNQTAAIDFDIRTALKGSRVGDGQRGSISRYGLLTLIAVFERFAVEGHGKAADFVQLLLNVQIAGDDAVAEILRIVRVGDFVVSVRLGIKPALNVPQDSGKCGYILPSEEHCVGHLDVGKAAVGIDDVTASAGNGDELRIVLRCGEHILLLNMQAEISGTAAVVGEIGPANTTPFRWAN